MAYALQSLVQILEQDQYHLNLDTKYQNQIQSLLEKSRFLKDIVQNISSPDVIPKNLERRVRKVVHKAEDAIEFHITNQIVSDDRAELNCLSDEDRNLKLERLWGFPIFLDGGSEDSELDLPILSDGASELDLTDVMEELDSIKHEIIKLNIVDKKGCEIQADLLPDCLPLAVPSSMNVVIGSDEDVTHLMEQLIGQSSQLRSICIVGEPGLGKTTLARTLYHHSLIISHFVVRAWVTISNVYNLKTALLTLLGCLRKITNEMRSLKCDQLGELLHNSLKGRRYLIVVHDIWEANAWDELRKFFPDDGNGSRIILTIRDMRVVGDVSPSTYVHWLKYMSNDESYYLLCRRVYGAEDPPAEFWMIARHIAYHCGGLPLAITMIAGLLSQFRNSLEFWELILHELAQETGINVARKVVPSCCYNYLPNYLKPCFLYVGAFPKSSEIQASKIIKLWIAEGFIKSVAEKNLEDTAEAYLNALIDRNLLTVSQHEPNGRVKSFEVHDVLKIFCLMKSVEDNFLCLKDMDAPSFKWEEKIRRVSAHPIFHPSKERARLLRVRSFLCINHTSLHLAPMFLCLRLLKVLDVFQLEFYQFPTEILKMVLLKFLAFSCHSAFPSSISILKNLQTLIIRRLPSFRPFALPSELWEMAQLRYIKSKQTCVILYCPCNEEKVQENLQTLSNVQMLGVTDEFLRKAPNLRKLGIFCNASMSNVIDLACLHKLEKLKCSSDWSMASHDFLSHLTFPSSLKKLTLNLCKIPGGFMRIISALPNLEELKVQKSDFLNAESGAPVVWETSEGEFAELLSLQMDELNLVTWEVNETSFPKLRYLTIRSCTSMLGIPSSIGSIPRLERMEVDKSSPSVLASALQIKEERDIIVHIAIS